MPQPRLARLVRGRRGAREAMTGAVRYCAVQPPSTEIVVPVIWSSAAKRRKATVPPSCAGDANSGMANALVRTVSCFIAVAPNWSIASGPRSARDARPDQLTQLQVADVLWIG